jgi:hypothetical protein
LCEEFENEKKKGQKMFDPLERGFEPQIFSNFPVDLFFKSDINKNKHFQHLLFDFEIRKKDIKNG